MVKEILIEIHDYLGSHEDFDYLWFNLGKNTDLHNIFKELIAGIKNTFPQQKVGAYTNGILFQHENFREILKSCDLIAINLPCVFGDDCSQDCIFNDGEILNSRSIREGIRIFNQNFTGYMAIFTLLMRGMNDTIEHIKSLKTFISELKPDQYSIGTMDGKIETISNKFKNHIREIFTDFTVETSFNF